MASSIGIDFSQDSPLFNKRVNDFDSDLSKLVDYFKTISKSMNQFCYDMKKAGASCEVFQNELRTGLHGIKSHSNIVQMMETVAEVFAEISSSQDILSNSLMHSFITPFEDFCFNEVAKVNQLQNLYRKEKLIMEDMMLRYLHCDTTTNHHLHRTSTQSPPSSSSTAASSTTTNTNNNSNTATSTSTSTTLGGFSRNITHQLQLQQAGPDCRAYDVVQSRKRFELTRYDMVSSMYELDQKKSFDVAETCIASLISLRSHYHYCSEKLHSCDKYINTLNKQQQDERLAYEVTKIDIATKRTQLSDTLQISVDHVTNQIPKFILDEYVSVDRLENVLSNISTHGLTVDDVERVTNVASNALSKITAFGVNFFGGGGGSSGSNTSATVAANKDKQQGNMKSNTSSAIPSMNVSRNQSPVRTKTNSSNINTVNTLTSDDQASSSSYHSSSQSSKSRKMPIQENITDREINNINTSNNNDKDSTNSNSITQQPLDTITTAPTSSNIITTNSNTNSCSVLQSSPQSLVEVEARVRALQWPESLDKFYSVNEMDAYAGVTKQGYVWEKVQGKNMLQPVVWNREWLVLDSTKLYFIKNTSTITSSGTSSSGSGGNNSSSIHHNTSNSNNSGSSTEVQVICDLLLASVKESKQPTIIGNNHNINTNNSNNNNNNTTVASSGSGSGMLETKTYLYTFEVAYANFKTYVFQAEGPHEYTSWVSNIRECIEKRLTLGSVASPYLQVAGNSFLASQAAAAVGTSAVTGNKNKSTNNNNTQNSSSNNKQSSSSNSDYVVASVDGRTYDDITLQATSTTTNATTLSQQPQQQQRNNQTNTNTNTQLIHSLLTLNPYCAECHKPHPEWISLNLGTFICIDCSGVHRSLGVHISKVRSLTLDDIEPEECYFLGETGNTLNHQVWQQSNSNHHTQTQTQTQSKSLSSGVSRQAQVETQGIKIAVVGEGGETSTDSVTTTTTASSNIITNFDPPIPKSTDNYTVREKFIRAKYVERRFLAPFDANTLFPLNSTNNSDSSNDNNLLLNDSHNKERTSVTKQDILLHQLFTACRNNDVSIAMTCIAHGVDINACQPFTNATVVNDVDEVITDTANKEDTEMTTETPVGDDDDDNRKPSLHPHHTITVILKSALHVAAENGATSCVVLLLLHGAESTYTAVNTTEEATTTKTTANSEAAVAANLAASKFKPLLLPRLLPSELAMKNGYTDLALYIKNKSESKIIYTKNNAATSGGSTSASAHNNTNNIINNNNNNNNNSPSKAKQQQQSQRQSLKQQQQPSSIAVEIDFDYTV